MGNCSEIHNVLSKSGTQSVSEPPQECVNGFVNYSIDLNVLVHSFVELIDTLESDINERKRFESST